MTKEEKKEYQRLYYLKNRDRLLENSKNYKAQNSERIKENNKIYNKNNADSIKKWNLEHRENRLATFKKHYQKHKFDRQENKVKAIIYSGSKCVKCGLEYNSTNGSIFDFHHTDPSIKDTEVSKLLIHRSFNDKIKKELDKCILVCANCHRLIHNKEY